MANNRLKESMKSLWINHLDPEKDEQQKWMKIGNTFSPKQPPQSLQYYWRLWDHSSIESIQRMQARCYPGRGFLWYEEHQRLRQIDTKVRRILKLIKSINQGNKEANLKKKSELIQLVEDFHNQYQSLYVLYDDLKEGIRNKVNDGEENSSSSSSSASVESDSYFSPDDLSSRNSGTPKSELQKVTTEVVDHSKLEAPYLDDTSEVVKEALNVEPVSSLRIVHDSEGEEAEITRQKLTEELSFLKERLTEREKEVLSLTTAHQVLENEASAKIKELEGQAATFKLELENLSSKKVDLEGEFGRTEDEAKKLSKENLELQAQISEFEERETRLSSALKKFEENEKNSVAKMDELMDKTDNLQVEVHSLLAQKRELEEHLSTMNKDSVQVKSLTDQVNHLQQELESVSSQKTDSEMVLDKLQREVLDEKEEKKSLNLRVKDLEMELEEKSREMSECVLQIENLKEKLERKAADEKEKDSLNLRVKDLEVETNSLCSAKSDLEEKLKSINDEANQSKAEKDELYARIFELEGKVREKETGLSTLRKKIEVYENENKSFKQKLDSLQTEKRQMQLQIEKERQESSNSITQLQEQNEGLTNKILEKDRALEEQVDVISKLSQEHKQVQGSFLDSKLSLKTAERKMEEMAEEFRKKFEDNIRLLSRRIRVAEQLHVESKEWYKKTQDQFEQDQRTNKEAFEKIKDITADASEMLAGLDTMALKFAECCEHFMNRISKVSCELHFVKDWVARKNKAIALVKEDFDCVLAQLDSKEEEILGLRQKVWKLENKVRELEKMEHEKEEGMLVLKEEKREAIRQLCVWIDYHRGRSDYLKKALTEVTSRNQARSL